MDLFRRLSLNLSTIFLLELQVLELVPEAACRPYRLWKFNQPCMRVVNVIFVADSILRLCRSYGRDAHPLSQRGLLLQSIRRALKIIWRLSSHGLKELTSCASPASSLDPPIEHQKLIRILTKYVLLKYYYSIVLLITPHLKPSHCKCLPGTQSCRNLSKTHSLTFIQS